MEFKRRTKGSKIKFRIRQHDTSVTRHTKQKQLKKKQQGHPFEDVAAGEVAEESVEAENADELEAENAAPLEEAEADE